MIALRRVSLDRTTEIVEIFIRHGGQRTCLARTARG
jgi:recombinational DNA repair protein (RecF pathway)